MVYEDCFIFPVYSASVKLARLSRRLHRAPLYIITQHTFDGSLTNQVNDGWLCGVYSALFVWSTGFH